MEEQGWLIRSLRLVITQNPMGLWCRLFKLTQVYNPAFQRFGNYLQEVPRCNHSLFIYDGELIAESELAEIDRLDNDTVIILHHQELAALIGSNFTKLVAA